MILDPLDLYNKKTREWSTLIYLISVSILQFFISRFTKGFVLNFVDFALERFPAVDAGNPCSLTPTSHHLIPRPIQRLSLGRFLEKEKIK